MAGVCSSCGFEVDDKFNFCPICGSKIIRDEEPQREKYKFCPSCGSKISEDAKICPNCGVDFNGKFRKIANKYSNRKSINKIMDLGASIAWKTNTDLFQNTIIKKLREYDDPAFEHVYDSIAEEYLKKLFFLERTKVCVGSSDFLGNVKFVPPTDGMSFDEAVKFYENLLEKALYELNMAKLDKNFDEEEYFKKKYKESRIELFANYPL